MAGGGKGRIAGGASQVVVGKDGIAGSRRRPYRRWCTQVMGRGGGRNRIADN